MAKKPRIRSKVEKDLLRHTWYRGYKVTASGVIYNKHGKIIKPKFYFNKKRIDYVYLDIFENGKRSRISYHRFVYMAWHKDFKDDPNMVITTLGRRFDYNISNLVCIPREEHLNNVAQSKRLYQGDELKELMETYNMVKDYMTIEEYAQRVGMSSRTLDSYIREEKEKKQ